MASGFDMMERGIRTDDMELIIKGFELATGRVVEPPRIHEKQVQSVTGTGMNKARTKQVKPSGINLFVDVEGERMAKKSPPKKPVKKEKREPAMVAIKCQTCKKKASVRKDLLNMDGTYTCNSCILAKGRN